MIEEKLKKENEVFEKKIKLFEVRQKLKKEKIRNDELTKRNISLCNKVKEHLMKEGKSEKIEVMAFVTEFVRENSVIENRNIVHNIIDELVSQVCQSKSFNV